MNISVLIFAIEKPHQKVKMDQTILFIFITQCSIQLDSSRSLRNFIKNKVKAVHQHSMFYILTQVKDRAAMCFRLTEI